MVVYRPHTADHPHVFLTDLAASAYSRTFLASVIFETVSVARMRSDVHFEYDKAIGSENIDLTSP